METRRVVVEARSENAQALFTVGREFDAAVSALQAGRVARELGSDLGKTALQLTKSALYRVHYRRNQGAWFQDLFNSVLDIKFSPDGEYLAVANEEFKTVNIFRLADAREVHKLSGHSGPVNALAFGPGDLLASAGSGGKIRFWNYKQGKQIRELQGHSGSVLELAFHPRTGRLASAGTDGEIFLWDAGQSQPVHRILGHRGDITGLAFAQDRGSRFWVGKTATYVSGRPEVRIAKLLQRVPRSPRLLLMPPVISWLRVTKMGSYGSGIAKQENVTRIKSKPLVRCLTSPSVRMVSNLSSQAGGQNVSFWRLSDGSFQRHLKGSL